MNKLTASVIRQLVVGMLFVAGGLTAVIWLSQSLRFVEMIIDHGASAGMFLQLTMLLVPSLLIIALPVSLFIVIIFIFSKMTADRELVVMSATGLSPMQIAKPVLIVAGGTVLLSYILNLYVLPESYRMFEELKWHIRFNYSQYLLEEGRFNSVGDKVTVYVRERSADNSLKGIFVHDARDTAAPVTIMAKRGSLIRSGDSAKIIAFDGSRQQLDTTTGKYSMLFFDRYSLGLDEFQQSAEVRTRDSRELSVGELFRVDELGDIPEHDFDKFRVEGHKRLIGPLTNVAFAATALVCLFAGGFTRRNQTKRIVAAVVVILVMQLLVLGAEKISARNAAMVPLLYAAIGIPTIGSLLLLLKPPQIRLLN
ncbi:MAG: LPS export ABC transporter permease LptF [Rhodospirillales bacterium]